MIVENVSLKLYFLYFYRFLSAFRFCSLIKSSRLLKVKFIFQKQCLASIHLVIKHINMILLGN